MALEPAGVSLQAEGFKQYVRQLDEIEKKQREAFEAEFKGTGKSYAQVQKAARDYERQLAQTAKAQERQAEASKKQAEANREAAQAQREAARAQREAEQEARKAGRADVGGGVRDLLSGDIRGGISGISSGLKAIGPATTLAVGGLAAVTVAAGAAVVGIGAIGVAATKIAADTQQATNQIAASLGIGADAAKEYEDELQNIFIANPQAQFTEIAEAIALTERALDGLTSEELENVANTGLRIEKQFGQDLQKTIGATEQLIEQFGLSSQEATDLLTFGLQNIPADDLIDTVGEYSNQFSQAGFSANEFFSLLQSGVAGGVLGTDRIADATKEFQTLFLEGSDNLKDSFDTLGLNFDQLSQQVNSGQRTIADVFGLVVDRAGEVDLSVTANRAAIAGLGTQFEDLGASAIAALDVDAIGFNDVAGATDTLNERFNNLGDVFESVKRSALVTLAPIGEAILELANSIIPKIRAGFEAVRPAFENFAARVVPAIEFAGEALDRLLVSLGGVGSGASAVESILNGLAFVIEGVAGGIEILARVTETFRQTLAFARAGIAAFGSIVSDVFNAVLESFGLVGDAFGKLLEGDFAGAIEDLSVEVLDFENVMDNAGKAAVDAFKESVFREAGVTEPAGVPVEAEISSEALDTESFTEPFEGQSEAIQESVQNLEVYEDAIKQAAELQRDFAREAEDNAIELARANEDIARKQAQQVAKLEQSQAKERDKLLKDQQKELDKFEADRRKQIAQAESDIQKERKAAAEQRKRDQQKLQRDLLREQEKFNLSQLQSERRFKLQESRLIAEGDVIGLKELREDFALQRQEEKENFDLSKKEQIASAQEQQKEQANDLENRLKELKANLEDQRTELLKSFDEQLVNQQQAQEEAKIAQQQAFTEQAAERQIQLQREEEDRRLSQTRQLEDLERSFAEQEGITADGAAAIATQIEKVFGVGGTADSVMTGFTAKTEDEFSNLFKGLEKVIIDTDKAFDQVREVQATFSNATSAGGFGGRIGGVQEFEEGGIVPGPVGAPQLAVVHGGEAILPAHQRSFQMNAPIISSQNLNVNMSGGFNITGDGQANERILQQATTEIVDNFRLAVERLARRN